MVVRTSISDCAFEIRDLVAKREYAEAVRRFEALASRAAPRSRPESAAVLIRAGGAETEDALAKAFARAPCYLCRDGRMSCDLCGGAKTFAGNGRFCEVCAGHGRVQCTFCGGSGFLPFDAVPANLTSSVAKRRLEWVARCLRQVVRTSAELKRAGQTPKALRYMLRLFNAVQQVTAVLDEVEPLVMGSSRDPGRDARDSRADRLVTECRRLSDEYRNGLARAIAGFCRKRADSQDSGSPEQAAWERQSQFFEAEAAGGPTK